MYLHTALEQIASTYHLDATQLKAYADEDQITGWDLGAGRWPVGSLWGVEGQVIYALIRATKPRMVLELGTGYGCSATHIASALDANGGGTLHCVDNSGDPTAPNRIGHGIPAALRQYVSIADQNIDQYIQVCPHHYDLVFEDGIHSSQQVYNVWALREQLLSPGGWLISHDAGHYIVGKDVRAGITGAGVGDALYLDIQPSDCGLAIWRKSGMVQATVVNAQPGYPVAVAEEPDYEDWTVAQLKTELQRRDVGVPTRARKGDLIDLLRANDKVV